MRAEGEEGLGKEGLGEASDPSRQSGQCGWPLCQATQLTTIPSVDPGPGYSGGLNRI